MNTKEEIEDQRRFDSSGTKSEYQLLFDLLEDIESDEVDQSFSSTVLATLREKERKQKFYFGLAVVGGTVAVTVLAMILMLVYLGGEEFLEIQEIAIWTFFGATLLGIIQLLDRVLIFKKSLFAP